MKMKMGRESYAKAGAQAWARRQHTEVLVFFVACLSTFKDNTSPSMAAALMVNLQHSLIPRKSFKGGSFKMPLRMGTKLKTFVDEGDFASYNDDEYGTAKDQGQQLAREFYRELESRERKSDGNDYETYAVGYFGDESRDDGAGMDSIPRVRIRAAGTAPSSPGPDTRRFAGPQAKETSFPSSVSQFPFFSFLAPAPRPAPSAGLFSGTGTTVYSSGRSVRAEIEILESSMKNNELRENNGFAWGGLYVVEAEQLEELLRILILSIVVASTTYVAIEASGAMSAISWEEAAATANNFVNVMNDATRDGLSDIFISVENADVFLGEEAAWLMKESSEFAASVVDAVRSVEELVLI